MEIREFEVRLEVESRSVSGIAVPYNETIQLGGFQERIQRGAFDTDKQVPLFFGHNHRDIPIGKVTTLRDTEHGLEMDAVLNDTSQAEDVYRALKAGDLTKFSIGFVPTKSRNDGDTIVREKADLKEVSVVSFPAYAGAEVSQVREENKNTKENKMDNNFDYSNEVAELRDSVADLERKFDKQETSVEVAGAEFRTAGEWMKGLAANDSAAREIATRDFATTVEADVVRPGWVNAQLKLVEKQRVVQGLFGRSTLPSTGNSIEYPRVASETGTVGIQAAEGADLPYMELSLETATAPVITYGGYSSLSRQAIERSDLAFLESTLRFQTIQYANATEKAVQDALLGVVGANTVELGGTGNATADQWLGAVIDAKASIDDNSKGLEADFILISRDVHRKLATMKDTAGRPIFTVNGDGSNTWGNVPAGRLAGVLDGTPVVVGKNLPANSVLVCSASALVSYESSGAPFRLQDENIINLTKDFSLYGYMAIAVPDPKGITWILDAE